MRRSSNDSIGASVDASYGDAGQHAAAEPERPVPAAVLDSTDPESHPELHTGFPTAPPYESLAADSFADLRTAREYPALNRHATHASNTTHHSHGQHSARSHGFAQSFRSLLPGSKRSHRDSELKHESDGENEAEKGDEEETPEDILKKQQDPKYLLDTILEEPEAGSVAQMVPLGDMAAEVSSSAGISTDSSMQMRRQGYHENLARSRRLRRYTKTSRKIKWFRHWYKRITHASLLIRMFTWWLPIALILFVPLAVGAFENRNMSLGGTRVMWIFIWLEVVWAALFLSKAIAHYVPEMFAMGITIFAPRFFSFVNMFVALEFPIQLVLWTFLSFITFSPILNDNKDATDKHHMVHWQVIIQDILVAFLVSAIVFLCEQVFMYFLSTNFHRTRMSIRIQEHKKAKNTLVILLDCAYRYFPFNSDEFEEEDRALYFHNIERAQRRGQRAKSKRLQKVTNAMSSAAKNMTQLVSDVGGIGEQPPAAKTVKTALSSKETSAILAERIWKSLVTEDSESLTYDDLISVLGEDRKDEVLYMFDILDRDGSGDIGLEEMKANVVAINREGKGIARSLLDVDGAITKLHHLLLFLCLIIVIVIFVGMLAPSSNSVLATLGSTLLSMSWLFSATAQEVFNSCIFLFVKHPFDVGDWVLIVVPGESAGAPSRMRVLELNLMYTVFTMSGTNIRVQTSNTVLNTSWLENITRSPASQIATNIIVGIPETRFEQLAELEYRLNEFCDDNPREYLPGVYFQTALLPDLDRLEISISFSTRISQDDIVQFAMRKTKALHYVARCVADIGIMIPRRSDNTYTDPSLPLFQYNVSNEKEAASYAAKATGLRKPYGLLPPLSESTMYQQGYVDSEVPQDDDEEAVPAPHEPLYGSFHPFAETTPANSATSEALPRGPGHGNRRASFGTYASRASSSATTSAAHGLRSRRDHPAVHARNNADAEG